MANQRRKSSKPKRPKGKSLSEQLAAKEAALDQLDEHGDEPTATAEGEAGLAGDDRDDDGDHDDDASRDSDSDESSDEEADDDEGGDDEGGDDEGGDDEGGEREGDDDEDGAGADRSDEASDDDDEGADDEGGGDDEGDQIAGQMGHRRYVIAGFFALWVVASYVLGRALALLWSKVAARDWFVEALPSLAAVPHEGQLLSRESLSLVVGGVLGGLVVLRYYVKPDIRTWADEVAEQLAKVKWPTRKEVGNHTVVVIIASAVITAYLTLLDRFWGFVTNLIYSSGA